MEAAGAAVTALEPPMEHLWDVAPSPGFDVIAWRQAFHHAEPEIACNADRCDVVGKQPVDRIHAQRQRRGVKPPPALIGLKRDGAANIFATPRRFDHHLGQGPHIAQPKVQPLSGNRMHAMRRIAHQRHTRCHETFCQRQ